MKTAKWRILLTLAIALLLGSGLTSTPHSQANASGPTKAAPTVCGQMSIVPSPYPGNHNNRLEAASALASNDVWTVGYYRDSDFIQHTLVEHWNGTTWSVVPSPNVGISNNYLDGVSALASDDVWAVGDYFDSGLDYDQTLVEHWDGAAWSVVPSPNLGSNYNGLRGVLVLASNDVWAVGVSSSDVDSASTLVEHWNGTAWLVVPSPNVGSNYNGLGGVSALASNDIWAVGGHENSSLVYETLVEHWDGTAWLVVPSPNFGSGNALHAVSAIASNDVWAVGFNNFGSTPNQTVVEHWDGTAWTVVSSPSPGSYFSLLFGVSAVASNDVYAVGSYDIGNDTLSLVEHWNGTAWSVFPSQNVGSGGNSLYGMSALLGGDVWAVGEYNSGSFPSQTLVERLDGSCGTPTSTPDITTTPAPTNTPGGPTNTPGTGDPFTDLNGNVFRTAIDYLYNHGAVNGTDATHYSPAGTSTRSQFAKVVTLGFGVPFYTPSGPPDFSDVPPSYFAYLYIESGFHAGILNGFDAATCNAIGATFPCYGPNRPITRGQITKLVVSAAHYPIYTPTSGQTFTDVGPTNVFFASIETAAHKGVINGYADHTFHPNNNVRRDAMAQIVYAGVTTP